jgi:glucose/mannose-6-phosphate isomerase
MLDTDDPKIYKQIDQSDMRAQLHDLPDQCMEAWQKALAFELPEDYSDIDKIVILGMGGSAIGGDLVQSLYQSKLKVTFSVNRDYKLPAYVDSSTLVIASSYSGGTEETLSAFNDAIKTGCKKLVMTTNGKLKEMAEKIGVPIFHIEHVSQPRAALGYSFMPLIAFLYNMGLLKEKPEVDEMVRTLNSLLREMEEHIPCRANEAKQIAGGMYGKIPIIYGAGILSEVAHRWKTQINENSKATAYYEILPELNHNSVVGYQFPAEPISNLCVVFLRCPSLHSRTLLRYKVTSELLEQNGIKYQIVDSTGDDKLSQIMGLIFLGDWVSYYLAMLYEIDPTPVKSIDYLKKKLKYSK